VLPQESNSGSSDQMLAGVFRFVYSNGLVCGNVMDDIRIKHSGDVRAEVIDGAFRVLRGFGEVEERKDAFKSMQLTQGEQMAYARAALAVRYPVIDTEGVTVKEPPIDRRGFWACDATRTATDRCGRRTTQGRKTPFRAAFARVTSTDARTHVQSTASMATCT
jgi:hypothetical protein